MCMSYVNPLFHAYTSSVYCCSGRPDHHGLPVLHPVDVKRVCSAVSIRLKDEHGDLIHLEQSACLTMPEQALFAEVLML